MDSKVWFSEIIEILWFVVWDRVINVCLYCNHVLGTAEDGKEAESDMHIADIDKKIDSLKTARLWGAYALGN